MLTTLRRKWAKWTRDERLACADCGRMRGIHEPGSPLYFIPQCTPCARKSNVADWCARFDPQLKQYVAACQSGIYDESRKLLEVEHEVDAYVHRLRLASYEHAKRGLVGEAQRFTMEANRAQAEWDASKAAAQAAAKAMGC